ncbi:IS3 family transposase [Pseudomonas yamanorum]|nr:IS3 family transposase [Pseudomonas yamanorum]QLG95362.1 IS3 family transposase [Pseudomonas yamanorum]
MTNNQETEKAGRNHYSEEFKQQALLRAVKDGVAVAARDLGLPPAQLYAWRTKAQQQGLNLELQRLAQSETARLKREVARLEEENAFPKKSGGVLRQTAQVKYATMKVHEGLFQVRLMCRVLSVSASGYYAWRSRKPSRRLQRRLALDAAVRVAFDAERARAGAPRLSKRLKISRRQVAESLRRQELRAKAARKFKATTNSAHTLPVAENLLKQDFSAQHPNQVWVGDITYLSTDEGWLYLAVVLDLYSRKVVGWSMSERMTSSLVCDALRMALFRRKMPRGVIMHTDRGSQYCSREHRILLGQYGLIASMSAKGNCYDNAAMESWNHSLKVEAIHGERLLTREAVRECVFDYIEVYYNRTRLHSTLGYLSPEQFELSRVA